MSSLPLLPSFRRQLLLLDFAALKRRCPEGIYLSPSPSDPSKWSGVFFVRKGSYASACLRFEISFPTKYPDVPPSVIFATEMFHPLIVPLTTYTFAAGALDSSTTISVSETDRLPPGSFSLRYGFPDWFRPNHNDSGTKPPGADGEMSLDGAKTSQTWVQGQKYDTPPTNTTGSAVIAVLEYVRSAFEDQELLDNRGFPKLGGRSLSPANGRPGGAALSPIRHPGDWNWDGVWEARVRNGIEESTSEALLFGSKIGRSTNSGIDTIRFAKYDDDTLEGVQRDMLRAQGLGVGPSVAAG